MSGALIFHSACKAKGRLRGPMISAWAESFRDEKIGLLRFADLAATDSPAS